MNLAGDTPLRMADAGAPPEGRLAACAAWLGEGERARHARFVRPGRRRQFLAGRALLRLALSRLAGCGASNVRREGRPGRAPALCFPVRPELSFGISHSGRWVAVQASSAAAVGPDIERIDPKRYLLALADQAFPRAIAQQLRACAAGERLAAFYREWCLQGGRIKPGTASGAEYLVEHAGFSDARCCAPVLAAAPAPEIVVLVRDLLSPRR